jgi:hypothetical protein
MSNTVVRRHATLARYLPSILKAGLLCSKSRGRKPAVWMCAKSQTAWACLHTIRRHGGRAQEVVVLEVRVSRSWLKRHGGGAKALWYSVRDIAPHQIHRVITFGELSKSPVEDAAVR